MARSMMISTLTTAVLASAAFAQLPYALDNPGFELDWQNATPMRAAGIRSGNLYGFSNNGDPNARISTTVFHTGLRSVEIADVSAGAFHGYTTDHVENFGTIPFNPNIGFSFLFFDVPIRWLDGALEVNVYVQSNTMNIPSPDWPVDAPEPFVWPSGFAPGAFKMEVKGAGNGNQNIAALDEWSMGFAKNILARQYLIYGNTNGQWVKKKMYLPARTPDRQGWKDQTEDNQTIGEYTLPAAGTWPNPAVGNPRWPDRCKFTIGRWNPSDAAATGSIFFDDYTFIQHPKACNLADVGRQGGEYGPDGVLDNNDFVVFIDLFFAQDIVADVGKQGGIYGHDLAWDNNDFVSFIDLFFSPCDAN